MPKPMAETDGRNRWPEAITAADHRRQSTIRSPNSIPEFDRRKRSPKAIEPEEAPAPAAN
jgi:hypothetical protein